MGLSLNPIKDIGSLVHDGEKAVEDGAKVFKGALSDAAKAVTHMSPSEIGHTVLNVAGMIPVIGAPADAINAGWYAAEGDWADAALSAATAIPGIGDFVGGARLGGTALKIAEEGADGMKLASKAGEASLRETSKVAELGHAVAASEGRLAESGGALNDAGKVAASGHAGATGEGRLTQSGGALNDTGHGAGTAASDAADVERFSSFKEFETAANHPSPNTAYSYGNYTWKTDAQGRTIEAGGEVHVQEFGRNPTLQTQIGHEGKQTDVGFHLIADSLDAPTVKVNVVPGNGKPIGDGVPNINQGAYKQFENEVRKLALEPGNRVEIKVMPRYSSGNLGDRPDEFIAAYRVNGGDWNTRELVNK
jgi:hypothetical protein